MMAMNDRKMSLPISFVMGVGISSGKVCRNVFTEFDTKALCRGCWNRTRRISYKIVLTNECYLCQQSYQ